MHVRHGHPVSRYLAMQPVRGHHLTLFSPAEDTMQLLMWRHMTLEGEVVHHVIDVEDFLVPCPLTLMMHQSHWRQPCAAVLEHLYRWRIASTSIM